MNLFAKPLRVELVWRPFEGRVFEHALRREVFVEGPKGVSFTHGVGLCGKKGAPGEAKGGKRCAVCSRRVLLEKP